jgi:hypothetical protein
MTKTTQTEIANLYINACRDEDYAEHAIEGRATNRNLINFVGDSDIPGVGIEDMSDAVCQDIRDMIADLVA